MPQNHFEVLELAANSFIQLKKSHRALKSIKSLKKFIRRKVSKTPRVEEYQATISYIMNINNTHFRVYASATKKYASNKHFMTYIA